MAAQRYDEDSGYYEDEWMRDLIPPRPPEESDFRPAIRGSGKRLTLESEPGKFMDSYGQPPSGEDAEDVEIERKTIYPERPTEKELTVYEKWTDFKNMVMSEMTINPDAEYKTEKARFKDSIYGPMKGSDMALLTPAQNVKIERAAEDRALAAKSRAEARVKDQLITARSFFGEQLRIEEAEEKYQREHKIRKATQQESRAEKKEAAALRVSERRADTKVREAERDADYEQRRQDRLDRVVGKDPSANLKRLGDYVASVTGEGKVPSESDVVVIKDMAAHQGYDFVNIKKTEPGSLWGTNETSEWKLVPKTGKSVLVAEDGQEHKDGDIIIVNGKRRRVRVK